MNRSSLGRRWFRWNAVAWLIGFVLYSPIAHGMTGGHARGLTAPQIFAHSIALTVVAMIVAAAQRRALRPDLIVSWVRIPIAVVAFNLAFWIGSYQPFLSGWDTDILLGFLALGAAVWLGNVSATGHRMAALIALLSFPVASVVAELGLVTTVAVFRITPDLQASEIQHSIFWITVGGISGTLGGWASGLALERMIPGATRQHAIEQELAADTASLRG